MAEPLQLSFLTSADTLDQLPVLSGEVAVIGRSNVGKSTLINALAKQKGLAKTSSTPGRTQLLNVFVLDEANHNPPSALVDLPGYGYAKASKSLRARWQTRMELYLRERDSLRGVLALVDGEVGPTKSDVATLRWLAHHELPAVVVATKADKVKPSRRVRRRRELAAGFGLDPSVPLWVSATTGSGIDDLRWVVREALGISR